MSTPAERAARDAAILAALRRGCRQRDVASAFGCSLRTVEHVAARARGRPAADIRAERDAAIVAAYRAGATWQELAAHYGRSRATVYNVLTPEPKRFRPRRQPASREERPMPDDLLTVEEAAARLGVTKARVYAFIHDGRLPASRDGVLGALRLRAADVAAVRRHPPGRPPTLRQPYETAGAS